MKNLSLVFNVILAVAVAVLYFLHFNDSSPQTEETNAVVTSAPRGKTVIAYINSDSLLTNYEYFKSMEQELTELQAQYDQDYAGRARGLQQSIMDFQQNAQNMTIAKAKATEEDLMKRQNNLRVYQEGLTQKLMKRQAELQDSLYLRVSEYLKDYGRDNNLDIVLTYQRGSGVLFASDSLNITQDVIEGLNKDYQPAESTN